MKKETQPLQIDKRTHTRIKAYTAKRNLFLGAWASKVLEEAIKQKKKEGN